MEKLITQMLLYMVVTGLVLAVLGQQLNAPDDLTLLRSYHALENTTNGTILFNFTARYMDRHRNVTVTSASPIYVTVEKVTGSDGVWNVRLNNVLDRETLDHIILNFDLHGDVVLPVSTMLFVGDVNDNPPKFEKIFYAADVNESTRVGTTVFTGIKTTDPDDGIGKTVSYNMTYVGSSSQNTFTMDSITGSVHLTGPLDFEKINLYHYIVTATDGGGLNSTADLIFTVLDVQDTPPFFTGLPYTVSVDEDTKAHTDLLQIKAEDGDRFPAISNAVKYSITAESCVGLFQLNMTGALSVGNTQLDRDSTPLTDVNGVCSVTVQATEIDTHPPQLGNTTATTTVTITVQDLNDNAPQFSSPSFTAMIKENSPAGVSLTLPSNGQIMVSDKDQGTNSLLTISLIQSGDTFDLEQTHIQSNGPVFIRVKNPALLDYEKSDTLSFTIVARDNSTKGPTNSASATVTVNIQPVNEFTPEFIAVDIKASVPEGSPVGLVVVNASAFDRDKGGSDGRITYSLQNHQGMFRIDPNTGVVTVASQATDREKKDTYNLLVQAQDGGGLINSTSLTITIEDLNDNKPNFKRTQYDAILTEDSTTFTRPLRLEASDDDKPGTQNSNITYTLSPNSSPDNQAGNFHIDPLTGEVTVVRPLDYESVSFLAGQPGTITLTAVTTDQGQPPLNSTVHVTITLLDINDNAPNFTQSSYSQIIKEDASLGSVVTTVHASDADGSAPNNLVSYFIESGAQDRFRINATTGAIKVSGPLDREKTSSYLLTIVTRDQAENPKSSNCTVNITLSDVNDEKPTFGDRSDVTIDVNETASGQLYVMTATDPDLNSQLRYSILWTESTGQSGIYTSLDPQVLNQWIGINNNTGALMALKPLNKTATRMFTLAIQVEDIKAEQNKPQSAKGFVKINIIDINNNPPRFSPSGSVTASVTENSVEGMALLLTGSIHVADLDENENSQFKLTLEGPFAPYFEVYPVEVQSSADVIIRVKNNTVLDYETRQTLDLKITAMETLTAEKRQDSLMVHVTIQDENDNSPVFDKHSYNVSIPENTSHGISISTVHAVDKDGSLKFNTVTYSLPDSNSLFLVDSSSGVVTVAQDNGLDYEKRQAYSLAVEATDGGGRRDTATLNVVITDINDNPPIFEKPEYSAFVTENTTSFDTPIAVKATDADAGVNKEIEYFIFNTSTLHQNFTVDKSTGQLSLVSPLDYESLPDKTTGRVTLLVGARDLGSPSLSTNVSVVVTVKDVNDNSPQFDNTTYHLSVAEDAANGYTLLLVHAHDADGSAPNNQVFYSIEEGDHDSFQVGHRSGEIKVVGKLDRETVANYTLRIMASDEGTPPSVSYCDVYIDLSDINDELPQFREKHVLVQISDGVFGAVYTMSAVDRDLDSHLLYSIVWNESYALSSSLAVLPGDQLANWIDIDTEFGTINEKRQFDSSKVVKFFLTILVQDLNAFNPKPQNDTAILRVIFGGRNATKRSVRSAELSNTSDTLHISKQGGKEWNAEVTFSAGLTHNQQISKDRQVVYDTVFINDGSGYSNKTGTFTCPQTGEFMFEVHTFAPRNSSVWLTLYHKFIRVRTLEVHAEEDSKADSMTVVLQLTKGDVVYVMSTPGHSSQLFGAPDTIWNTFSGYLLSPHSEHIYKHLCTVDAVLLYQQFSYFRFSIGQHNRSTCILEMVRIGLLWYLTMNIFLLAVQAGLPPDIVTLRHAYLIPEDTPPGSILFNFRAVYSDNHRAVTVGTAPNSYVTVQPLSAPDGLWNVLLNYPLDRETLDEIQLNFFVLADDVLEIRTTLYVTDVNDNPPTFERSLYTADVSEDTTVGTTVFTDIRTRDPDTGVGGVVTYSMTPVDSDARDIFVINSISGSVTLNQRLYSRTTKSYYYIVTATDGDGLSSAADLIFVVRDGISTLSTRSPSWTSTHSTHTPTRTTTHRWTTTSRTSWPHSESTTSHLTESSTSSSSTWGTPPPSLWSTECDAILHENEVSFNRPLHIQVTDEIEPGSESSNIMYSLSSSSEPPGLAGHFHIDPFTGDVSVVQPLDFDNISFSPANPGAISLTAIIRDHGRSPLSSTSTFTIILLDINDNTPQFEKSEYISVVPENVRIGYQLMVVRAHDADGTAPNNQVFYFLETGGRDQLAVDHVTGAITVVGELDRESVATYSLHVMARDQAADPLHSYCTVYINVSDINDEPPRFREKHVTIDVSDGAFGDIYDMSAVDLDLNSHLKYSILWEDSYGQTGSNEFLQGEELMQWVDVDADNGMIHEKRPLDRTQVRQLNLLLLVQDLNATDPKLQEDSAYLIINVRALSRSRRSPEGSDVRDTSPFSNHGMKHMDQKVTFSAGLSHYLELTEAEPVVYDRIFVNEGNGYSSRTGIFTCPQSGKYVFGIDVLAAGNSSVSLSLYHKVSRVRTFEVHAGEDSKADGVTAVLQVTHGDDVYVAPTPRHSSRLSGAPHAILNTFSGSLLSPAFE
ncbi:protocadherin Fat 4-like [Pomacea canaliculata]|uniref:protocadherin Fat 4-like n=1 Tax=Pomacea canaliculata TaxID=400727 RepID=UPI000D725A7B|nr:protocadherin Fat 4-like [Pomacea canaliculata]